MIPQSTVYLFSILNPLWQNKQLVNSHSMYLPSFRFKTSCFKVDSIEYFYFFLSLELAWKYPFSLNTLNCIQRLHCWEIKENVSAFFKKVFSIDIDRKNTLQFPFYQLLLCLFYFWPQDMYLLRGPENLRSQLKLTFHHRAHTIYVMS